MAEVLEATLQLEIAQFVASLQQAAQTVTAFANAISGSLGSTAQVFQQQVQKINEIVTVTKQAAQTKKDVTKDEADFQKYIDDLRLENWKNYQKFKAELAKQDAAATKQAAIDNMAQERAVGEFIMKQLGEGEQAQKAHYEFLATAQKQFFATTMALAKEAQAAEEARLTFLATAQARFFATTVGLATERAAKEKSQLDFQTETQRVFFATTTGLWEQSQAKQREDLRITAALYKQMEAEKQLIFRQTTQREIEEAQRRVITEKEAAAQVLAAWVTAGREIDAAESARAAKAQQRAQIMPEVGNLRADQNIRGILGQNIVPQQELFLLQGYINLLEKATPPATMFEQAITRIGTSFKTLAGYAAAGFLIALPFKLIELAKEATQTAIKMDLLNNTFIAIGGSAAAGARTMEFLRSTAQRVGVDFVSTAESFRGLSAAAAGTELEGGKINKIFEQMTSVSRVLGMDSSQLQRAFLALEQMISKGTITSEELRKQLGNALPGALNIMAESLGVTTKELNEMMKAGDLISVDVLPRFMNQVEHNFGPGLEKAANSAAATFARFGNNAVAVAEVVGDKILAVLKPIMDVINAAGEMLRKANEQARTARENSVGAAPERPDSIAEAGGKALQKEIDDQRKAIENQQQLILHLEKLVEKNDTQQFKDKIASQLAMEKENLEGLRHDYQEILDKRKNFLAEQQSVGIIGGGGGAKPFAKQYTEMAEELAKVDVQLGRIALQKKLVPEMFKGLDNELDMAKDKLSTMRQALENIMEINAKAKGIREGKAEVPADIAAQIADRKQQWIEAQAEVDRLEKAKDDAAEAERKRKAQERADAAQAKKDVEELRVLTEKFQLATTEDTKGSFAEQRENLQLLMDDWTRLKGNQLLGEKYFAAETRRIAREETAEQEKFQDDLARLAGKSTQTAVDNFDAMFEKLKHQWHTALELGNLTQAQWDKLLETGAKARDTILLKEEEDFQNEVAKLRAKGTKTELDNFDAAFAKTKEHWEKLLEGHADKEQKMTELSQAATEARAEIERKETEKALKEQQKGWRALANSIESALAGAFESVLKGTKNLFEGIRDAFLKLLAKLAAEALTHAIIIPAIFQLVGGGTAPGAGGGSGGLLSAVLGAGGTGQQGGNGGGGNNLLGSAVQFAGYGSTGYSLITGRSLTSGTSLFAGIGSTTLSEIPGVAGLVGAESAWGAESLSSLSSGIGTGLAVGLIVDEILKMINNLIGFKGLGASVAAGAGAGAAGGAVAGSIIPVIGTGIGALVGTILGAIGGLIGGLVGGKGKQPEFKILDVQAGEIEYNNELGLIVKKDFKILKDFHQKLGTDYEEFIKVVNDAINASFHGVVENLRSAPPDVQRALVEPMNSIFQDVAILIRDYPKIGGEQFKEELTTMLGTDIPKIFADAANHGIEQFSEAVAKVSPVIKAFSQIIDVLLQDITELQKQQKALDDTLAGDIASLEESLMSPADILARRQQQYNDLLTQFQGGDEATRIELAPKIGELAKTILELSKSILSMNTSYGNITGINAAIKQLEETFDTPAQTLVRRQTELNNLMEQFRAGTDAVRAGLAPEITQLSLEIMNLAEQVNILSETQALIANFPAQLRSITEAFFSPAQSYLSQRQQLAELMTRFRAGTPEEQLALEPQIAQLAAQILQLAQSQDVLGQDPQALRQLQSEMLAVMQEVQSRISANAAGQTSDAAELRATLERTQAQLISVLREVQTAMAGQIADAGAQTIQALWQTAGEIISTQWTLTNGVITATYTTANGTIVAQYDSLGHLLNAQYYVGGELQESISTASNQDSAWSAALYEIQAALIDQVASVREYAWYSYTQLQDVLWEQVALAKEQIQLLIDSLSHLETVDEVVRNALGVLGEMNARLGNPLRVNSEGTLAEQLSRDSLQSAQQLLTLQGRTNAVLIGQLGVLAGVNYAAAFQYGHDITGYQHGGYVPRNMQAFLHAGEQVIPSWENRGGGTRAITISVYGGNKDPGQIADEVIRRIETKSGRLHNTTIQTSRR